MTSTQWSNVRRCLLERELTAATELDSRRCAAAIRSIDRLIRNLRRRESVAW